MNFLLVALKTLDPYKEFIVLVCILFAILSLVVITTKAYIAFKEKQVECEGRFNLQDFKINSQDKKIDSIGKKADEAVKGMNEMKPKVDDIHDWFVDKYKNRIGLQDG